MKPNICHCFCYCDLLLPLLLLLEMGNIHVFLQTHNSPRKAPGATGINSRPLICPLQSGMSLYTKDMTGLCGECQGILEPLLLFFYGKQCKEATIYEYTSSPVWPDLCFKEELR